MPLSVLIGNRGVSGIAKNGKPICFLTFDDGWKDFYDNAFPLLKKYNKQATVFLPTDFIGSGRQFWADCFAHLFTRRQETSWGKISDPDILKVLKYFDNNLQGSFNNQLEDGVAYLKKYPLSKIENVLRELPEIWNVEINGNERAFLAWEETIEMKDSGLVSFGSHTVNHQILTTIDDKAAMKELVDSREKLLERKVVDRSCIPFCYPNGNYTEKVADMVLTTGYHLAVTTERGWNNSATNKFTLKRVGIHEDMASTTEQFACRITGLI